MEVKAPPLYVYVCVGRKLHSWKMDYGHSRFKWCFSVKYFFLVLLFIILPGCSVLPCINFRTKFFQLTSSKRVHNKYKWNSRWNNKIEEEKQFRDTKKKIVQCVDIYCKFCFKIKVLSLLINFFPARWLFFGGCVYVCMCVIFIHFLIITRLHCNEGFVFWWRFWD